jgi:hypothetical protein
MNMSMIALEPSSIAGSRQRSRPGDAVAQFASAEFRRLDTELGLTQLRHTCRTLSVTD